MVDNRLAIEAWRLEFGSLYPNKNPGVEVYACSLSAEEVAVRRTSRAQRDGHQYCQSVTTEFTKRPCLKQGGELPKKTFNVDLWPPHRHEFHLSLWTQHRSWCPQRCLVFAEPLALQLTYSNSRCVVSGCCFTFMSVNTLVFTVNSETVKTYGGHRSL